MTIDEFLKLPLESRKRIAIKILQLDSAINAHQDLHDYLEQVAQEEYDRQHKLNYYAPHPLPAPNQIKPAKKGSR